jgi:hypothetical protein
VEIHFPLSAAAIFRVVSSSSVLVDVHVQLKALAKVPSCDPRGRPRSALTHCLEHWKRLTLFPRQAGAPPLSNLVERALKKAILRRKKSQLHKTKNGAGVGDLSMSLIRSCELNDANPLHYSTELKKHTTELAKHPTPWMPWNCSERLGRTAARVDSRQAPPAWSMLPFTWLEKGFRRAALLVGYSMCS